MYTIIHSIRKSFCNSSAAKMTALKLFLLTVLLLDGFQRTFQKKSPPEVSRRRYEHWLSPAVRFPVFQAWPVVNPPLMRHQALPIPIRPPDLSIPQPPGFSIQPFHRVPPQPVFIPRPFCRECVKESLPSFAPLVFPNSMPPSEQVGRPGDGNQLPFFSQSADTDSSKTSPHRISYPYRPQVVDETDGGYWSPHMNQAQGKSWPSPGTTPEHRRSPSRASQQDDNWPSTASHSSDRRQSVISQSSDINSPQQDAERGCRQISQRRMKEINVTFVLPAQVITLFKVM